MRYIILSFVLFLGLLSCESEKDIEPGVKCINSEKIYREKNGAALSITRQEWIAQKNNIGGVDVSVKIYGSIKGDSAFVRSYGDGLIYDVPVKLNSSNEFEQLFGIFFTSSPYPKSTITTNALVIVYSGKDSMNVHVKSCPIPNVHHITE